MIQSGPLQYLYVTKHISGTYLAIIAALEITASANVCAILECREVIKRPSATAAE